MAPVDNNVPDRSVFLYPALATEPLNIREQKELVAVREDGEKPSSTTVIVFRYDDLPVELQDLIIEAAILAAQNGGEKLSRLAVVDRHWQEPVEKHTFARLGEFPAPSIYSFKEFSSFQAADLPEFCRLVVGKRRAHVRHIAIDFKPDMKGMPELPDSPATGLMSARQRAQTIWNHRLCQFAHFISGFFCNLHAWDPAGSGPSYVDVSIRVCGRVKEQECTVTRSLCDNFMVLPHVGVVRSFEVCSFRGLAYGIQAGFPRVPPNLINLMLNRLPQLHSATIDIQLPCPPLALASIMLSTPHLHMGAYTTWNEQVVKPAEGELTSCSMLSCVDHP